MFCKFIDFANDLKTALIETDHFRTVRVSTISDYKTLFKVIDDISLMPAAVVCLGAGQFSERATIREFSPAILVVDRFRADAERGAAGVWDSLEAAVEPFLPDVTTAAGRWNQFHGVEYWPGPFRPVTVDGYKCAYVIEFEAVEPIQADES